MKKMRPWRKGPRKECRQERRQSSHSLSRKEQQLAGYARVYGYAVVGYFVDSNSAKNTTGFSVYQKMIAEVDKGRDEYIRTDRMHLVLINQGINTELPSSRQFLLLIVVFAQLERERTSERVKGIIGYIRT